MAKTPFELKGKTVYVAGHRGLAGSAIVRRLRAGRMERLVCRTHAELDLTNPAAVDAFFAAERPEYVFLAAAKVGASFTSRTPVRGRLAANAPLAGVTTLLNSSLNRASARRSRTRPASGRKRDLRAARGAARAPSH